MKRTISFFFFLFLFLHFTYAQSYDDSVQRQSYVFDNFINGSVLLKSGERSQAPLNYCSYDQTILFQKDGKIFTLTGLTSIDTIYINERKFVPLNNSIYEVVDTKGKIGLYLNYTSKMRPWSAATDQNGTTKQSNNQVSNTVTNSYISRPYKGDYSIEIIKHYWLKDYRDLHKANTIKDFLKVFKESANAAIREYVKENNIDFRNETDLKKLLNFCNKQ